MARYEVDHPLPSPDMDKPFHTWYGGRVLQRQGYSNETPVEVQEALDRIFEDVLTDLEQNVLHCIVDQRLSLRKTAHSLGLRSKSYVHRIKTRAYAKMREAIMQDPILKRRING